MRHIFISAILVLTIVFPTSAQDVSTAELRIERLSAQLRDVIDLEARLQERSQQLEADLRPENVERSVAGVGTRDATALRAGRREQIEKQKADVDAQLSEASARRARLEAEIAAAEAEAVRLKAAALGAENAAPRSAPAAAPVRPAAAPAVRRNAPARKRTPRKRNRPRRRA